MLSYCPFVTQDKWLRSYKWWNARSKEQKRSIVQGGWPSKYGGGRCQPTFMKMFIDV
jgi:hypothetical protein